MDRRSSSTKKDKEQHQGPPDRIDGETTKKHERNNPQTVPPNKEKLRNRFLIQGLSLREDPAAPRFL